MNSRKTVAVSVAPFALSGNTMALVVRCPIGLLLIAAFATSADLSDDDRKLLQDKSGWEYISMSDSQNGFPTAHACFDGKPHPDECSGTLILREDGNFSQTTRIRGQAVSRSGRYELEGNQLSFFDELTTKDGPYTLDLNRNEKTLKMSMPQLTVEMMLVTEYRARQKSGRSN